MPLGILAVTCTRRIGSFFAEADIKINSRYSWAATVKTCHNQELIEPTLTHEVGHVFGLGHVGERKHPLLTMSNVIATPHIGASTVEAQARVGLEVAEILLAEL